MGLKYDKSKVVKRERSIDMSTAIDEDHGLADFIAHINQGDYFLRILNKFIYFPERYQIEQLRSGYISSAFKEYLEYYETKYTVMEFRYPYTQNMMTAMIDKFNDMYNEYILNHSMTNDMYRGFKRVNDIYLGYIEMVDDLKKYTIDEYTEASYEMQTYVGHANDMMRLWEKSMWTAIESWYDEGDEEEE